MVLPTSPLELEHHHHIIALETQFCPIPEFQLPKPYTFTLTTYPKTVHGQIAERIRDASVLIITTIGLNASVLSAAASPKLLLIAVMATGTDSIDLEACRARGIVVCNCGGANVPAVAEHALGMYFSTRRRFVETQNAMRSDMWMKNGTLIEMLKDDNGKMPLTCKEEVLGLIGYGAIGNIPARIGYQKLTNAVRQTDWPYRRSAWHAYYRSGKKGCNIYS
jgi:lactate dehydrogenase-like 2-hydroxyacid dehydrogenase